MQDEGSFQVRHRYENEDIGRWMHDVQLAMTLDHRKRSPHCIAGTVEYAKIPMPENSPIIGGVPKLNS